ncbi:hypothetical protein KSD_47060 [Ktedonobacter sp. SOSP1-85]|uniref:hypothetical protein n=1 Tax=Ktedonobacter sp. SOSP1-85 TaxID=2778367 RepID=UPI001914FA88|nr:hypothetical protein [Ktedonobacter sp. SOSP1-85]GHO76935.1 hypothetical protein KSD_47060 [Ktedonobacter sp. SOSP1-85]
MLKKYQFLWVIILGGSLAVVLGLSWLELPWMANHFGFALPGQGGLPYRITYATRTYVNHATCAHAGWCQTDTQSNPLCWKEADIRQHDNWPLIRIGTITTLFGSPYSLIAKSNASSKRTVIVIYLVFDTNCYVPYALEGGP